VKSFVAPVVFLLASNAWAQQYPNKPMPIGGGPDQLERHIRSEIARWNKVLTAAGVQPTD